jgi:hypothetical protein
VQVPDRNSVAARQTLIDNWLTDVRRRGAELYAANLGNAVNYFSFQGKDRLRYSVEIDFDSQELRIEVNRPEWKWVKRETYLLNAGTLRLLARRMCPVPEGQTAVPVYLLVRLSILCHTYQRLLEDYDREHHIHTSSDTVRQIESELRQYLTPEEQQRTDNPFLEISRRDASIVSAGSVGRESV